MTTYSVKTINLARIINLAEASKNELEKFLIQQNLIQFNLMLLITIRAKLSDKEFFSWIENKTLGELIQICKTCLTKKEKSLVSSLRQYNKRRRFLVHKIFKDPDFKKVSIEAKNANSEGLKILESLRKLLNQELRTNKL